MEDKENKEIKASDADLAEILDFLVDKVNDGTVERLKEDYGNDENLFTNIQFIASGIFMYGESRKQGLNLHDSLVTMVSQMIHHPHVANIMQMAMMGRSSPFNFGGKNFE